MKETEQTLFLKSNLLHIRTNEGEFVVSNQNELHYDEEEDAFILNGTKSINWEWPGEVEIKCTKNCRTGADCDEIQGCNLVARLLPKEEKKHEWTTDEIMSMVEKKPAQPTPNFPKGGTTFTESAYKEFEECPKCRTKDFASCHSMYCPVRKPVESSEPQDKFDGADPCTYPQCECKGAICIKRYDKDHKAPIESQEEMWNEVNEHISAQIGDYISLEAVKLSFILTRKP